MDQLTKMNLMINPNSNLLRVTLRKTSLHKRTNRITKKKKKKQKKNIHKLLRCLQVLYRFYPYPLKVKALVEIWDTLLIYSDML